MEDEFIKYEKLNNGVFPIKLFENMLFEIDINTSLVTYISLYVKRKTQKVCIYIP
jgi:hypothetical protein